VHVLFAHCTAIADDASRPLKDSLSFRREGLESRSAMYQQHAHLCFELSEPRGKRRLRHPTGLGGTAEVLLARQCENEFELVDHAKAVSPNHLL
jgi:hypothetical protein